MYFSRSKVAGILAVCLLGILLALPNLFPRDQLDRLPDWMPHRQINLGLDLKGGAYLLLQLDLDAMRKEQLDTSIDNVRTQFRTDRIGYTALEAKAQGIHITLRDPAQMQAALDSLKKVEGFGPNGFVVAPTADGTGIDAAVTQLGAERTRPAGGRAIDRDRAPPHRPAGRVGAADRAAGG